jgi:multiple sugar transport system substrate-binding protein
LSPVLKWSRTNRRSAAHGPVLLCILLWTVSIAAILLTGCNSNNQSVKPSRLVFWSANNQDEINVAHELVAEWNRLHPDIPVEHQPVPEGESSEEVILAAVVGKTTPDVYSNMWPGDVESYVRAKQLVCLDDFSDFNSMAAGRFSPSLSIQARSRDGHTYQVLWKTNPIMMQINLRMFRSIGYARPPVTYAEYLQAAAAMTRDANGDGYTDQWIGTTDIRARWRDRLFDFYPLYIAATGGKTLLENGQVSFDNPQAVAVFRFFQTLFLKGYFPREIIAGRRDPFLQESVASRITGPWEITHTDKFMPEGFEYDFCPVPVPDSSVGQRYTYMDPKSIVIFKNTRFPREAWEFVKYLTSKNSDLELLRVATQLPIRTGLLQDPLFQDYFLKNPKMVAFARQAQYITGVDATPALKEIFDAISQEFEACVVWNAKTPEQAVRDAAERARLVLE